MLGKGASGWQMVTADLALILFIITASAVDQSDPGKAEAEPEPKATAATPMPAFGQVTAVYREQSDLSLERWLQDQRIDPHQTVTVLVEYAPGEREEQLRRGGALLGRISSRELPVRLLANPSRTSDVTVIVAHDVPPGFGTQLAE